MTDGSRPEDRTPEEDRSTFPDLSPGQIGLPPVKVQRLDDPHVIRTTLDRLCEETTQEALSALPGGPFTAAQLRTTWDMDVAMLRRGVRVQAVYQADTARVPQTLTYLAELAAEGAQIRVSPRIPHRVVVFDRRIAVVPAELDGQPGAALVVSEPVMVRSLFKDFEVLWRAAYSVGVGPDSPLEVSTVRETLEVLRSGLTDDAAARQLQVSVRTMRRRVAAVLDLLGATSRFEAGVRAVEAGWL